MKQKSLNNLTKELDELLLRMQTPKARAGMRAAFHASPRELGEAARGPQAKREDVKPDKKKPEKLIPPPK